MATKQFAFIACFDKIGRRNALARTKPQFFQYFQFRRHVPFAPTQRRLFQIPLHFIQEEL